MAGHSMSVQLPESLYDRLHERAMQAHRRLEDEVLSVLAAAVAPMEAILPPGISEAVEALAFLDDARLWRAAASHLPVRAAKRLAMLKLHAIH